MVSLFMCVKFIHPTAIVHKPSIINHSKTIRVSKKGHPRGYFDNYNAQLEIINTIFFAQLEIIEGLFFAQLEIIGHFFSFYT